MSDTGKLNLGFGLGNIFNQDKKSTDSTQYLVEGAKLMCVNGSCITQLKLPENHNYTSGGKQKANCKDCKACVNIPYFGECKKNQDTHQCEGFMDLVEKWENTTVSATKAEMVGGEDAISMSSVLMCKKGGIIIPVTSGQGYDGAINWAAFLKRYQNVVRWTAGKNMLCHVFGKDPINMNTGNYIYEKEDLIINGPMPLSFKLFYNAMDCGSQGDIGVGWSHNYGVRLVKIVGEDLLGIILEDGREIPYRKKLDGDYAPVMGDGGRLNKSGSSYLYEREDGIIYEFDCDGRLRTQKDKSGKCRTFTYDGAGLLERVENGTGDQLKYKYNKEKNLIYVEDHTGRKISLKYQYGKLRWFTNTLGNTFTYKYNENGKLDEIVTPNGISGVKNNYDGADRVVKQIMPDGGEVELRYDDKNNLTFMKEQNGNMVIYECDDRMRNLRTIYEDGEETFAYNDKNQKISYTDKNGNVTRYAYDNRGNITQIINALGQKTNMTYNASNQLIQVKDPGNGCLKYNYDCNGNCTEIINQLGISTKVLYQDKEMISRIIQPDESDICYQYDHKGNVILFKEGNGGISKYKYDLLNRIIESVDGNQNITKYEYDNQDNLVSIINAAGKRKSFVYEDNRLTLIIDYDGSKQVMNYNDSNKPYQFIDQEGNITIAEYNTMNMLTKKTLPNGRCIQYSYNHLNQLECIDDGSGGKTKFKYDRNGNRTNIIDPLGNETVFSYDTLNRNVGIYEPDGNFTTFEYNYQGKIIKITDNAGRSILTQYDALGRNIKETDVYGRTLTYVYNNMNLPVKIIDGDGLETLCFYYKGGLLKRIEYSNGVSEDYKYDANENITEKIINNGYVLKYEYDILNQLTGIISNLGERIVYEYDEVGNVASIVDGNGNRTKYSYSPAKRLTEIIDAIGNKTQYVYDNLGDLISIQQSGGISDKMEMEYDKITNINSRQKNERDHSILYKRDLLGRVESITDALSNTNYYNYDEIGNLVSMIDSDGYETKYKYNLSGQITEVSYGSDKKTNFVYNSLRQLIEINDCTGKTKINNDIYGRINQVTDSEGKTVNYRYNANNQKEAIIYPDGSCVKYIYDKCHRLSKVEGTGWISQYCYNDKNELINKKCGNGLISNYNYDVSGRLNHFTHSIYDETIDEYYINYDAVGNKKNIKNYRRGMNSRSDNSIYYYDKLNRLEGIEKNGEKEINYLYDAYGNRICTEARGEKTIFLYNSANQLIKEEGRERKEYNYDKRGNLISFIKNGKETYSYEFDEKNRLANFTDNDGLSVKYEYNGLGFRIGKSSDKRKTGVYDKTKYVIDLTSGYNNLLRKETSSGGQNYIWDENLAGTWDNNGKRYFWLDDLGSPIRYLANNGTVLESYSYDEFGNILDKSPSLQPFGFTGYQLEEENNNYFAQAREYMPSIGRFISNDSFGGSLGITASLNYYNYCFQNPLRYVDPWGYYTSKEGREAHEVLQAIFMVRYPGNGEVEKKVTGYPYSMTGTGSIDMYLNNNGSGMAEVYEIKPISQYHHNSFWNNAGQPTGTQQRKGYIQALRTMGINNVDATGTTFDPNGWTVPCPTKPNKNLRYYTFPDEPGMVYWGYVNKPKKEPVVAPSVSTEKGKNAEEVAKTVGIGVGSLAGGYLLYRAIRMIPSLFFPPSIPLNFACP